MVKKNIPLVLLFPLVLFFLGCSPEAPKPGTRDSFGEGFWAEDYAEELEFPWAMVWLPDGSLLITERLGKIKSIKRGATVGQIKGVPEVLTASPFDGLLDIQVDPDFASNSYIYLTYTTGSASARIGVVYKATLEGNQLIDGKEIFRTFPPAPTGGPNITRMQFLPDKSLLVAVGSSGNPGSGMVQRLDGDIGKILRINRDGSIPSDNPFRNSKNVRPELWAIGLRSVGGMAIDYENRVWAMDMGPQGGDELNLLSPGGNYGWPAVTWGFYYSGDPISTKQSAPEFDDPINVWSPSISPFGLNYYEGKAFPNWQGDFFVGAMGDQSIFRLKIRDNEVVEQERLISHLNERIRSIETGPDGFLYALTDASKGRIIRIRPGQPEPSERNKVSRPVAMSAGLDIMGILEEHGVMQDEETMQALYTPYDPPRAERIFQQSCSSCHDRSESGRNGVGPNLFQVIGRNSGSYPDFVYSKAMSDKATSIIWDASTMAAFLSNPEAYYPGNKMAAAALDYADALQVATYLEKSTADP